jgi:hypothetical protein
MESKSYFHLGVLYKDAKQMEKSIHYFKKAVEVHPDWSNGYFGLGSAYWDAFLASEVRDLCVPCYILVPYNSYHILIPYTHTIYAPMFSYHTTHTIYSYHTTHTILIPYTHTLQVQDLYHPATAALAESAFANWEEAIVHDSAHAGAVRALKKHGLTRDALRGGPGSEACTLALGKMGLRHGQTGSGKAGKKPTLREQAGYCMTND